MERRKCGPHPYITQVCISSCPHWFYVLQAMVVVCLCVKKYVTEKPVSTVVPKEEPPDCISIESSYPESCCCSVCCAIDACWLAWACVAHVSPVPASSKQQHSVKGWLCGLRHTEVWWMASGHADQCIYEAASGSCIRVKCCHAHVHHTQVPSVVCISLLRLASVMVPSDATILL